MSKEGADFLGTLFESLHEAEDSIFELRLVGGTSDDPQVSRRESQADFLRFFSRVLESVGWRDVKVTGVHLRVVLWNHP